ncbi:MAG: Hsp70 family protein [Candidatus Eisenbacteria bacterium]
MEHDGFREDLAEGALTQRFAIGIDLGTTNSAVATIDLSQHARTIRFFEIPQLVAPGEVASRSILPSFLYLPGSYDLAPGSTALPWDDSRTYAVGELAREQGARVPGRLVSSAKSWLAHAGVDRGAPILPWGTSGDGVSPVEASRRYLQHIRESWDAGVARGRDGFFFHEQLVILTVPASFDEVARELTLQAARDAGIPRPILLEEPLAAFYAWLSAHEETWQAEMEAGQLVLVCDVGGGTTDFSLIGIQEGERGLRFTRFAVGEHLMLGGDNMDHALARHLESRMTGGERLDPLRWHQLVHRCRRAKEELLGGRAERLEVTLPGEAGRLVAGTLQAELTREDVAHLLIDGFFPVVGRDEAPAARRGLTELGLPYVHDPR